MKERLLKAYFTNGLAISNIDTLVELATETGIDPATARTTLESDAYADDMGVLQQISPIKNPDHRRGENQRHADTPDCPGYPPCRPWSCHFPRQSIRRVHIPAPRESMGQVFTSPANAYYHITLRSS